MDNTSFSTRYVIPCLVQALQAVFLWAVLTYITIYWIDLGFSHLQVGIFVSVFPLTSLLLMIPFGLYVDRISPKKLVIASEFIFALAIAGLMTTHDLWATMLFLVVGGIGNSLFSNALPALFYKTLGNEVRGFKLGIFSASTLVGYGLGPLLAGYILQTADMQAVFMFALAGVVPLFIVSLLLADAPGMAVKLSDYKADLSNKSVLAFIILVFFFSLHAGPEQASLSLFLNKDIGLDKEGVGWVYFIHANVMALLSIVNGIVSDRVNARGRGLSALFYAGVFISGITNISLFLASSFGTVLATRLSHAVGDSLVLVTRSLIISNLFVTTRMGGNLGVLTTTITLATLVGSIFSGAVPGYVTGFVIAGILAVMSIPIVMATKPEF
jgi:MFS transporter, DHA1 family, multidrug resistance protein